MFLKVKLTCEEKVCDFVRILKISVIQSDIRALQRVDSRAPMCRHFQRLGLRFFDHGQISGTISKMALYSIFCAIFYSWLFLFSAQEPKAAKRHLALWRGLNQKTYQYSNSNSNHMVCMGLLQATKSSVFFFFFHFSWRQLYSAQTIHPIDCEIGMESPHSMLQ